MYVSNSIFLIRKPIIPQNPIRQNFANPTANQIQRLSYNRAQIFLRQSADSRIHRNNPASINKLTFRKHLIFGRFHLKSSRPFRHLSSKNIFQAGFKSIFHIRHIKPHQKDTARIITSPNPQNAEFFHAHSFKLPCYFRLYCKNSISIAITHRRNNAPIVIIPRIVFNYVPQRKNPGVIKSYKPFFTNTR